MATTIKLKNSVTTTNAPSSLAQGEVAINITDKKVWVGNAATTPIQLLGDGGSVNFTTVDTTNLQVTNIKAKDGTASASIANSTGAFTVAAAFAANGGATLGDASGDALTINSSAVSIPNGLNFDSNLFVIDAANDRIGIGTSSPTNSLTVVSSGSTPAVFLRTSNTIGAANYLGLQAYNASNAAANYASIGSVIETNTAGSHSGALIFVTSSSGSLTERMRITSAGNVGIGTSSPAYKLDVSGSGRVTTSLAAGGAPTGYGVLQAVSDDANTSPRQISIRGTTNGNKNLFIGFNTTSDYGAIQALIDGTGYVSLALNPQGGNVGIGTSSPGARLSAYGGQYTFQNTGTLNGPILGPKTPIVQIIGDSANNENSPGNLQIITPGIGATVQTRGAEIYLAGTRATNTQLAAATYSALQADDAIGALVFSGDNGVNIRSVGAAIRAFASGIWSSTSLPTYLTFNTTPSGSVANSERMRLDSAGNLGLGITPSAWGSFNRAIEFGSTSPSYVAFNASSFPYGFIYANAFYDGTNNKYKNSSTANAFGVGNGGAFQWYTAPSGTAGNTITFTQAMTLDASGNLQLGTTGGTGFANYTVLGIGAGASAGGILQFQGASNADGAHIRLERSGSTINSLVIETRTSAPLVFGTNGSERMRINAGAPILCLAGGNTSATGTGIAFPATQSASSDANCLDDYEEGTWTPSVGGTATYGGNQFGYYVKVGRLVTCVFAIEISSIGTGSTTTLSGFPFTSANDPGGHSGCVGYYSNLAVNTIYLNFYVNGNATTANFNGKATSGATMDNSIALFGNSTRISGSITYRV